MQRKASRLQGATRVYHRTRPVAKMARNSDWMYGYPGPLGTVSCDKAHVSGKLALEPVMQNGSAVVTKFPDPADCSAFGLFHDISLINNKTCSQPHALGMIAMTHISIPTPSVCAEFSTIEVRSEERRVGKECRSRCAT